MRLLEWIIVLTLPAPSWAQQSELHRRVDIAGTGENMTWVDARPAIADAVYLHGPGIRFEGPPKKGAPYSAEAVTETVQVLRDGNRIVRENRAKVYRDSEGRTRREEKLQSVGPWAVAGEQPTRIFINDPLRGEHWVLEPENKIARRMKTPKIEDRVGGLTEMNVDVSIESSSEARSGESDGTSHEYQRIERQVRIVSGTAAAKSSQDESAPNVESLGTRMIEGVEAQGRRITRTIPAGQIGNERPIEVVYEQWRSEELGVDVMTKRSDPRSAETTYKLINIQRTEPLPGLFEPPPDYDVQEAEGDVLIRRIEKK